MGKWPLRCDRRVYSFLAEPGSGRQSAAGSHKSQTVQVRGSKAPAQRGLCKARLPKARVARAKAHSRALGAIRGHSERPGSARPPIQVPPSLQKHMASWGAQLMHQAAACAGVHKTWASADLRVGTDCSGLDAPILALRAMGVQHRHIFSCDVNRKIQQYTAVNFPGVRVYQDMLKRKHSSLGPHNVYVCGFPCKPFSSLHSNSRRLRDPKARPFFAMLQTLKENTPQLAVLENVIGLRSVLHTVFARLQRLKQYHILVFIIDPADMGEPVRRPRYYFVLVRRDVANFQPDRMDEVAGRLMQVGCRRCDVSLAARLLPSSSPVVQQWLGQRRRADERRRQASASKQGRSSRMKWQERQLHLPSAPAQPIVGLTARSQSLLGALLAKKGLRAMPRDFNVDVSQSLGRSRLVRNVSPTITPRGQIVIGELGRMMTPAEKCLANLVPLHELRMPAQLTDTDLADLAGNTMHLMAASRPAFCRTSQELQLRASQLAPAYRDAT